MGRLPGKGCTGKETEFGPSEELPGDLSYLVLSVVLQAVLWRTHILSLFLHHMSGPLLPEAQCFVYPVSFRLTELPVASDRVILVGTKRRFVQGRISQL